MANDRRDGPARPSVGSATAAADARLLGELTFQLAELLGDPAAQGMGGALARFGYAQMGGGGLELAPK
jgi:hypothetical protein